MKRDTNSVVLMAAFLAIAFIIIPNADLKLYELSNFFYFTKPNERWSWVIIFLGAFLYVLLAGYCIATKVYDYLLSVNKETSKAKRYWYLFCIFIALLAVTIIINYYLYHRP